MTTTNPRTEATAQRILACIEAADYPALVDLYSADVLLDMNLPTRRFQHQGIDDAGTYLQQQVHGLTNLRCTDIGHVSTDDTVVVESASVARTLAHTRAALRRRAWSR